MNESLNHGHGVKGGTGVQGDLQESIPDSESPPSVSRKETEQEQVRGLTSGCAVFEVPQEPQGRLAGAVGL